MASPRPGPPSSARKAKNTPRTVVSRANIPSLKLQAPPPIEQLPLLIAPSILSPRNTSPRAKTSNPFAFPQLQIPTPSEFGVLLASNPEEPLPQPLQDWLLAGVSLGITLAAGGAILSTKVPPVTQLLLLLSSVTPVTVETIQDSLKPQPPANKKTGFRCEIITFLIIDAYNNIC